MLHGTPDKLPIHDMNDLRPFAFFEAKWQAHWEEQGTYVASDDRKTDKFYGLIEFPYPSGDGLHVGHPRSYTAIDVVTRKRRMEGKNVLYPIGWDAFGLPTENYAIKNKLKPQDATAKNITTFERQLKSLGFGFDWSRLVNTTDPAYYKWTQWMFLQFFKSTFDEKKQKAMFVKKPDASVPPTTDPRQPTRLAYKDKTTINWCPSCKIGLANEEAIGGVCERCGGSVEKREKAQWMIAITKYAERLLNDLDTVDYLDRIKAQQVNWIGRSEGAHVDFAIRSRVGAVASGVRPDQDGVDSTIRVFTTRPDTLFGATYLVLAPEHEFVARWIHDGIVTNDREVNAYRESAAKKSDMERGADGKEKTGVRLEGVTAINPANNEEIPVWIADYVLAGYGTGAIMAVPAHDARDFAFAKAFDLPIRQVIAPYIQLAGARTPREDKKTVRKNVVTAIIKDVSSEEYLVLTFHDGRMGFAGGGIEDGETPEEAVLREVKEETGLKKIRIERVILPELYGHGYKLSKDTNCYDRDRAFLVIAEGKDADPIPAHEQHTLVWKKAGEITDHVNLEQHQFMWDWYQKGGGCYVGDGLAVNSDFLDGLAVSEAKEKAALWLEKRNSVSVQ